MGTTAAEPVALAKFGLLAVGLFCMALATTLLVGPNPVAEALFPLPVAICIALGWPGRAGTLCAAAAGAGLLALWARHDVALGAYAAVAYAGAAALGVVLGFGLRKRWRYGRIVAAVTAAGAMLEFYAIASDWTGWLSSSMTGIEWLRKSIESRAKDVDPALLDQQLKSLRFFEDNIPALAPGSSIGTMLILSCLAVTAAAWWLRRQGARTLPKGGFVRTIRPPDWLAWVLILAVGLWFADQRWPHVALRWSSWNALIVLSVVYWLNGLSVLAYATTVLRPHFLVAALMIWALLLRETHLLLAMAGLFDTWFEFRRKVNALALARRRLLEGRDRDDDDRDDR